MSNNTTPKHSIIKFTFFILTMFCYIINTNIANAGSNHPIPIKGDFSLVDETGKRVTLKGYKGKYLLIYFGYTYCPDICPTSLGIIAQSLDGLAKKSLDKILPLFISIDPERDTVEYIKEYTDMFHPSLVGLTGSVEEASRAAKTFGVYFAKAEINPKDKTDYSVDHSSNTYFVDPKGRIIEIFGHAPQIEEVINSIESHLAKE
ncbi:MAG: SCO family protein [Magnetococcales bacterium]|nr:SCO family protein [Magnetococcales bacterium]